MSVGDDLLKSFRFLDGCNDLAQSRDDLGLGQFLEGRDAVPRPADRLANAPLKVANVAVRMWQRVYLRQHQAAKIVTL